MSWQNIAASETDANSPLNQTLMDKIRGNLDDLHSRADSERVLLNLGGEIYSELEDWHRIWKAYATVSTDPGHDLLRDLQVYVPATVTELRVSVYAKASSGTNAAVLVTVGQASAEITPLPISYEWSDEVAISNPGSGWQAVKVGAYVTSGGSQLISLAGMVIRTA